MNNPTFLTLFSLVFILLGSYNVFTGSKRIREAHERGVTLIWYKQINILTGVEYILLALVFIVSSSVRANAIPSALKSIVVPIYFVLLLAAAILAGLVIRQGIMNARTIRAQSRSSSTIKSNGTSIITERASDVEDTEQNAENLDTAPRTPPQCCRCATTASRKSLELATEAVAQVPIAKSLLPKHLRGADGYHQKTSAIKQYIQLKVDP